MLTENILVESERTSLASVLCLVRAEKDVLLQA